MSSGNFASGKVGKIILGSTTLKIKNWSHQEVGKVADVTNTGGNGVEESLVTTVKYSGSFSFDYDLDAQPQDEAPGIFAGRKLQLEEFVSAEAYYLFTEVEVQSYKINSEVGGVINCSVDWQAQSAPTVPGVTAYSESSSGSSSSVSASSSSSLAG